MSSRGCSYLAFSIAIVISFCGAPAARAVDLYIPFFNTSDLAANESICDVYKRASVTGCKAGSSVFFLIDRTPGGGSFTVKK